MKHITKKIALLNIIFLLSPLNASENFSGYEFDSEAQSKRLLGQVQNFITNTHGVTILDIVARINGVVESTGRFREKLELLEWFEKSSHGKKTSAKNALPKLKKHLLSEVPHILKDKSQSFKLRLKVYDWADTQDAGQKEWLDILFNELNSLAIDDKRKLSAKYKKLTIEPETNPRKTILESIFNDPHAKDGDRSKSYEELKLIGFGDTANELMRVYTAEQQRIKVIEEEAQAAARAEEERLRELQRIEDEARRIDEEEDKEWEKIESEND